mmetsp:Transcript_7836/g.22020  ORF Transcript_7836/g.22020 Transcript_7836/m.22020 type:complete len:209 (+) Transcript_7836:248-874(+)
MVAPAGTEEPHDGAGRRQHGAGSQPGSAQADERPSGPCTGRRSCGPTRGRQRRHRRELARRRPCTGRRHREHRLLRGVPPRARGDVRVPGRGRLAGRLRRARARRRRGHRHVRAAIAAARADGRGNGSRVPRPGLLRRRARGRRRRRRRVARRRPRLFRPRHVDGRARGAVRGAARPPLPPRARAEGDRDGVRHRPGGCGRVARAPPG